MEKRVVGIVYRHTVLNPGYSDSTEMEEMMLGGGEDSKTEFFKLKFYSTVTYILVNEKLYI